MSAVELAAGRPRILLVRTSSLGDVVHSLPVLTALRRHLSGATLGWVIEGAFAPLLAGHPDLDRLLVVHLRRWGKQPLARRTLAEVAGFLGALRRFSPEIVLDLMGNHKAGVIAALSLSRRRIGHARRCRREPSSVVWLSRTVPARGTHAADRALSLLDALGLPSEPADFGGDKLFRGTAQQGAEGGAAPPGIPTIPGGDARGRFALLHPGAGWGNKIYPPGWWGAALRQLHHATGVGTLVTAGPGEEGLAAEVVAAAGDGAAVRLAPACGLAALATLMRQAALTLGGDTGPVHLAHALGRPVLMVMGPTDPDTHGPYGAAQHAVFRRLPCSFCHRRFSAAKACLLEIPPERLAERAAQLLVE